MKIIFGLFLLMFGLVPAVFPGTLTLIYPNGGETLLLDSNRAFVTWRSSGTFSNNVKLTLWRNGRQLGLIARDLSPAAGRFSWAVGEYFEGGAGGPQRVAETGGGYTIKIKEIGSDTSDVSNGTFRISRAMTPGDHQRFTLCDLEITRLFPDGDTLKASVRCNRTDFSGGVQFMVASPVLRIYRTLNLRRGVETNISLCQLDRIERSRQISCMIDSNRQYAESNESNNTYTRSVDWEDLSISCRFKRLVRLYGKGRRDYDVKYEVILKNLTRPRIGNVSVRVEVFELNGRGSIYKRNCIKSDGKLVCRFSLNGFQEKTVQSYTSFARKNFRINPSERYLKKGKRYRFQLTIDPEHRIEEINERNNTSSFSFGIPD